MIGAHTVIGFVLSVGVLIWITHIIMTTDFDSSSGYFVDPSHRKQKRKRKQP